MWCGPSGGDGEHHYSSAHTTKSRDDTCPPGQFVETRVCAGPRKSVSRYFQNALAGFVARHRGASEHQPRDLRSGNVFGSVGILLRYFRFAAEEIQINSVAGQQPSRWPGCRSKCNLGDQLSEPFFHRSAPERRSHLSAVARSHLSSDNRERSLRA
jgi:hypothetical protein